MQSNHVSFHDDINIHSIYNDIVSTLDNAIAHIDDYEKEYNMLKNISIRSHNPSDKSAALVAMRNLDKILPSMRDRTLTTIYKKKVLHILRQYDTICGKSRVFGMDECTNIPKRVGLIMMFLNVCNEYTGITYTCSYDMSKTCPKCFSPMKKCGTIMVCDSCSYAYRIEPTLNMDIDDKGIRMESTYDACKNFRKEYAHVCGVLNDIADEEKEDVDSYLYRAGIREPKHEDVRDAIRACGYSNYHDTNLLLHRITGHPLPNIYHHIDICSSRFELYFRAFHSIDDKEGQNITNIHFLIRLFLWQEGVPYDDAWFRSLSMQTESKHIRNAKKVCALLSTQDQEFKWNVPPTWI